MMTKVGSALRSIEAAIESVRGPRRERCRRLAAYNRPQMTAADAQDPPASRDADSEMERLRRQLRALSLVNRQLHTQLEGGVVRLTGAATSAARGALTVRRTAEGGAWLEHLHLHGGGEPMLVRTPTQGVFVVEGHM